jgi:hypothetical protein
MTRMGNCASAVGVACCRRADAYGLIRTLRELAERCRQLALIARSEAVRQHLLAMARDMDRQAAKAERQTGAMTDRQAG